MDPRPDLTMDDVWTLLLLSLAMLVGCYLAGSIPLAFSLSEVSFSKNESLPQNHHDHTQQYRHHLISHAACGFACSCDFGCSVACEFTLSGVKRICFFLFDILQINILRMVQVIPPNNSR